MVHPEVQAFFDEATFTVTYVASCPKSGRAAVIDPVLDYDPASGRTATRSADAVIEHIRSNGLSLDWILETHIHADHLSGAPYIREALGGRTGIGEHVAQVQENFKDIFNLPDLATDGSQFEHLFRDGEKFSLGEVHCEVLYTPGHTPACVTYVVGNAAFVGDTMFMPDYGTARCDFPGGDAAQLYDSIQRVLALPDDTRLFMCHDYKAPGRDVYAWETSVAEQRERNIHLAGSKDEYVQMRESRDAQLSMPKLILPAIQVNIRAGELPAPEDNNIQYLKIPVDAV